MALTKVQQRRHEALSKKLVDAERALDEAIEKFNEETRARFDKTVGARAAALREVVKEADTFVDEVAQYLEESMPEEEEGEENEEVELWEAWTNTVLDPPPSPEPPDDVEEIDVDFDDFVSLPRE